MYKKACMGAKHIGIGVALSSMRIVKANVCCDYLRHVSDSMMISDFGAADQRGGPACGSLPT